MAAGLVDPADDARRLATIFEFWSRAAGAYRFDDGTHQAADAGGTATPVPRVRRGDRGRVRARRRRRNSAPSISRLNALLTSYLFLLWFDTRSGYQDTGPYRARRRPDAPAARVQPARRVALPVERGGVRRRCRNREVLGAFVLRDTQLRVTDFGTSVTQPEDYWPHVEAFAFFDVSSGALVAIDDDATRRAGGRRRRPRRSSSTGRSRAWSGAAKIDAGAYVYFTFLRPFAELAGVDDRLDRAARQPDLYPFLELVDGAIDPPPDAPVETPGDVLPAAARRPSVSRWLLDFVAVPATARSPGSCGSRCATTKRIAWYWTYLVGVPGVDGCVVVRDHEVLPPRRGSRSAPTVCGRSSCETPRALDFGLEAFGVRLDDPDALRGGEIGDGSRWARHRVGGRETARRGVVHGDVLVGASASIDGPVVLRRRPARPQPVTACRRRRPSMRVTSSGDGPRAPARRHRRSLRARVRGVHGRLVGIYTTAEAAAARATELRRSRASARGRPVRDATGTYSNRRPHRQVTFVEREVIATSTTSRVELGEHETRRNLVTEGVPLHSRRPDVPVGDVVSGDQVVPAVRASRAAHPPGCGHLENRAASGPRS